ncbi:MAG: site-specific integrase [Candidatus Latescibacteria bacterium]|nr:site-specific integrase [Candidatus Latescibacterota bacterium]
MGYLAEVNYTDPHTGRRIREQKSTHRLDLAREWRQTRKADALRGEVRGKKDRLKPMLFSKYSEEYLSQWSKVEKRESSYRRDQVSLKRLNHTLGKRQLSEITRRDVEKYVAERKGEGVTSATTNRELCCLKNMFRKAVDWGYLKSNPAWGVKQQKETPPEFGFLTENEIDRVIECSAPHMKAFLTLAIHTGMRRGELFKLEWRDLDFQTGFITVRYGKNGETRHIPMNSIVRQTLDKHPNRIVKGQACPYVFSRPDGSPFKWPEGGFQGALQRAGVTRHIRIHDLRHTFASHLVMKGIDLRTVAKLLGHRDIKMTMRYSHLAPEHLQAAVEVLTQRTPQRQAQREGTGSP